MSSSKKHISIFCLMIVFATLICGSCKKAPNPGPNEVFMENKNFYPNQLVVTKGTTVKWTDKDALKYTVTDNNNAFDSGKLDKDQTFSYTFNTAGKVYNYYSSTYPNMTATIVVQ